MHAVLLLCTVSYRLSWQLEARIQQNVFAQTNAETTHSKMAPKGIDFVIPIFFAFLLQLRDASSLSFPKGIPSSTKLHVSRSSGHVVLSAYHFGASADTSDKRAGNFPYEQNRATNTYVPDGLTEEQYKQIKEEDMAKLQGKNFAAWGPRFAQIDGDPQGNWFSISSLWTAGFTANQNGGKMTNSKSDQTGKIEEAKTNVQGAAMAMWMLLRRYVVAYFTLLLSTHVVANSLSSKAGKLLSSKWLGIRLILPLVALKLVDMLATFAGRMQTMVWLGKNGTAKMSIAIGGMVALISLFMRQ